MGTLCEKWLCIWIWLSRVLNDNTNRSRTTSSFVPFDECIEWQVNYTLIPFHIHRVKPTPDIHPVIISSKKRCTIMILEYMYMNVESQQDDNCRKRREISVVTACAAAYFTNMNCLANINNICLIFPVKAQHTYLQNIDSIWINVITSSWIFIDENINVNDNYFDFNMLLPPRSLKMAAPIPGRLKFSSTCN